MATTKSGEKATKVRGYKRIWLLDGPGYLEFIEVKPGIAITEVDTKDLTPHFENWKYATVSYATRNYKATSGISGWLVRSGSDCSDPIPNRATALSEMRIQLAATTNWHWRDAPAADAIPMKEADTPMTAPELQSGTIYPVFDRKPHLLLSTDEYQEPWTDGRVYHGPIGPLGNVRTEAGLRDWLCTGPLALEGPAEVLAQVDPAALLARVHAADFSPLADLPEGTDLRVLDATSLAGLAPIKVAHTVTAEERRRAQCDGYVECSECGAPIEQHDTHGFDDGSGKTCTVAWSQCQIEDYRQACGLPRTYEF